MKLQEFALLATLLAAYCGAYAAGAAVSGTAVINGKTVAFSQGRAWKTGGFSMGSPPAIEFLIAEKSLDGLDALAEQADFSTGKRGRVFHIRPHAPPFEHFDGHQPPPPYKYDIDADSEVELWANDFGLGPNEDWQGIPLSKSLVADDIRTVDNGWLQGTLEWKGEKTQTHMSDDQVDKITAFKLTFNLPLEEARPGKK